MTSHMLHEIETQGDAWAGAIEAVRVAGAPLTRALRGAERQTLILGAGSSYYLGLAARGAFLRRGVSADAAPASEILLHPELHPLAAGAAVIAVSRSGTTTETLRAVTRLQAEGALTIGVTTVADAPIRKACEHTIAIPAAAEASTVQTRSFSAQLVATLALAALQAGDQAALTALHRLPTLTPGWIERAEAATAPLAGAAERVYVLGTGDLWGIAMEGALKLKETSLTEAEAFQTLEFRHGPQSMVDERTLVVGLVGDDPGAAETAVLRDVVQLGGRVLMICEDPARAGQVPHAQTLAIGSGLPLEARLPLYLPPLQLLAHRRGVDKDLDPDHPRHLRFSIELEQL